MSGSRITYDGSPVRLRGVATEDVYDLQRDWRTRTAWEDFAHDYVRTHNRNPARP